MAVSIFSPAKLNLFLAVTGQRADGFHDLVSVAAPLDFGDQLVAKVRERRTEDGGPAFARPSAGERFSLTCDDPAVPIDGSNLILKAAQAFVAATGWTGGADFSLTKRIPMGAGLGGGSSNAVAALRALNQLSGDALPGAKLAEVAASLGSDCPLFLANAPVVMRGRGERIEALPAAAARLRGRRVLLFKPSFGISTPWAYGRMAAASPAPYRSAMEAEARLADWLKGSSPAEELLANNMEGVAFAKFIALPVLLAKLQCEFGVAARLSGSGSACFALLRDDLAAAPLVGAIRAAWGPRCFVQEARLI